MKKIEKLKKELELGDINAKRLLYKRVFRISLIYLIFTLFMMIFSLIFLNKVNKLSFISPIIFVVLIVLLFIYLLISFILSIKNYERLSNNASLNFFKVFDTLSYVWFYLCVLLFVFIYFLTPSSVSGISMNNTLNDGDRLLIWHLGYTPKDDNIVIIDVTKEKYPKASSSVLYIKRVVATSGDYVLWDNNEFYVNNELVSEYMEYDQFCTACGFSRGLNSGTIKEGYSVCLGDNRWYSEDGRKIGLINNDDILGKAIFRFYPFKSIGKMKKSVNE